VSVRFDRGGWLALIHVLSGFRGGGSRNGGRCATWTGESARLHTGLTSGGFCGDALARGGARPTLGSSTHCGLSCQDSAAFFLAFLPVRVLRVDSIGLFCGYGGEFGFFVQDRASAFVGEWV
jgi:hypothetical protein